MPHYRVYPSVDLSPKLNNAESYEYYPRQEIAAHTDLRTRLVESKCPPFGIWVCAALVALALLFTLLFIVAAYWSS